MTNITIAATESDTDDFTAVLNLPASPETVMALFTSATGVTCWWGATEGDGAVGGTLITRFGDNGVNAMRVIESTPTRVVWEPIAVEGTKPTGHTKEWLGTTVEFDVAAVGTGSRLRFRHAGLTPGSRAGTTATPRGRCSCAASGPTPRPARAPPTLSAPRDISINLMALSKQSTAPAAPDLVLRALADPNRRQILRLVNNTELPAGQIASTFTLTQQAVSQHIGVLKEAGLLTEGATGRAACTRCTTNPSSRSANSSLSSGPTPWGGKKAVETAHPRPKKQS